MIAIAIAGIISIAMSWAEDPIVTLQQIPRSTERSAIAAPERENTAPAEVEEQNAGGDAGMTRNNPSEAQKTTTTTTSPKETSVVDRNEQRSGPSREAQFPVDAVFTWVEGLTDKRLHV